MRKMTDLPLFSGMDADEISAALACLRTRKAAFKKGSVILSEGQIPEEMGVILRGSVTMERLDSKGNKALVGYCRSGQVFAGAYAVLSEPLLIDVIAGEDCDILFIHLGSLPDQDGAGWTMRFRHNLLRIACEKNLELSIRCLHTFPKHIRERVLSYLSAQARERRTNEFDISLNRQQMADYLNLDRSALSGELGRMRDDGLIDFHGRHFRLRTGGSEGR